MRVPSRHSSTFSSARLLCSASARPAPRQTPAPLPLPLSSRCAPSLPSCAQQSLCWLPDSQSCCAGCGVLRSRCAPFRCSEATVRAVRCSEVAVLVGIGLSLEVLHLQGFKGRRVPGSASRHGQKRCIVSLARCQPGWKPFTCRGPRLAQQLLYAPLAHAQAVAQPLCDPLSHSLSLAHHKLRGLQEASRWWHKPLSDNPLLA